MKQIRIKKLALENFKCHKNLTLEFNGGDASIYGDNATGKTSIYDALTWLLFGKDSKGNGEKNIEIKPLNELGEVRDHLSETAVEAVLLADGEEITLRRTLKEVWSTKRGNTEATYDGNTSEYYIDGVPCKKYIFSEKIDELVDEDTFRLLTSVSHFADGISWQDRRAVLFKVAAVADDEHIMATDARFNPLVESMGKLSVDDYKKKLVAEKRGFVGAKTEIPARISECQKTIEDVQALDFASARVKLSELQAEKERIDAQIVSIENNNAIETKKLEIREARLKLTQLEGENANYRASQSAGTVNLNKLKTDLLIAKGTLDKKKTALTHDTELLDRYERGIVDARNSWIALSKEAFEDKNCPTCGQALPAEQQKKAQEAFEASKRDKLTYIEAQANEHKNNKAVTEARIEATKNEIEALEANVAEFEADIKDAESAKVEVHDMPDYAQRKADINEEIEVLNGELHDLSQSVFDIKDSLQKERSMVAQEIQALNSIISKEALLEYSRKRVEELQEEARNAAACLDTIENMLYLIEEYTRYKTQFVEDSINSMFRIARFRLFREQANGGIEDRCDVVYEGVPYININSGAKINVGVDIINTLSTAYGVSVPLFVDNAESVTKLENSTAQIIRLVVSEKDKELRVNYEN
jgi:DNA repair exonuclease SbcCD ATPase subunit